jgi:hypothetical protein
MTTERTPLNWRGFLGRYAWIAGFALIRTHYFLIVIVGQIGRAHV